MPIDLAPPQHDGLDLLTTMKSGFAKPPVPLTGARNDVARAPQAVRVEGL